MADFPARGGRSSGEDVSAAAVFGCFIILISLTAWLVGFIMLFHGLATKDGWEAGWGGAILAIMTVTVLISRANQR